MSLSPLFPRQPEVVAAGAVHVPGWLGPEEQRELVDACRRWGEEGRGFRSPRMPRGGVMSVEIACLGWHWLPYRYSRHIDDGDGRPVPPFPPGLAALSRRAVRDASAIDPHVVATTSFDHRGGSEHYDPDVALINWYAPGARMGMHVDRDEKSPAPVVSVSLGDACTFRFGTPAGRGRPWKDVRLESGDLFVFGGPSRLAYHGVPRVVPATGPVDLGLGEGRFNITVRQSGLVDPS
jgi:DNA oxidative demethylase